MKFHQTIKVLNLAIVLSLVSLYPSRCEEKTEYPLVARATHCCGERRYVLERSSLTPEEKAGIQDILSFLYDGASILFQVPGAPAPKINESTRKSMLNNSYLHDVELKNIKNPTPEQIDQAIQKLYDRDPTCWNIHEGPKPERIK